MGRLYRRSLSTATGKRREYHRVDQWIIEYCERFTGQDPSSSELTGLLVLTCWLVSDLQMSERSCDGDGDARNRAASSRYDLFSRLRLSSGRPPVSHWHPHGLVLRSYGICTRLDWTWPRGEVALIQYASLAIPVGRSECQPEEIPTVAHSYAAFRQTKRD